MIKAGVGCRPVYDCAVLTLGFDKAEQIMKEILNVADILKNCQMQKIVLIVLFVVYKFADFCGLRSSSEFFKPLFELSKKKLEVILVKFEIFDVALTVAGLMERGSKIWDHHPIRI